MQIKYVKRLNELLLLISYFRVVELTVVNKFTKINEHFRPCGALVSFSDT